MGVENKKAVTTDPGEEPLAGPESCVTAFLLALHFQQCSHCITQCQAVQYLSCLVGCWWGEDFVGCPIARAPLRTQR